jgi:hypothetical protein
MERREIRPPGQHPTEMHKKDIDAIAFALDKLRTFLFWIDEHRSSFEANRTTDPENAESGLHNLRDSTEQAMVHLQRLTELLLAGYTIDPNKRLPKGLYGEDRLRSYLDRLRGR